MILSRKQKKKQQEDRRKADWSRRGIESRIQAYRDFGGVELVKSKIQMRILGQDTDKTDDRGPRS